MKEFFRKYFEMVTLLFWCAMIFGFSSVPTLQSGLEEDFLLRKMAHMAEYAVLAYLFCVVIHKHTNAGGSTALWAGLATLAYALTDEIHQTFVSGRSGNFFDIGVDLCGILFTSIIYFIIIFKKRN